MRIINTKFYPTVERRIRPIAGAFDQTMLYRVVMDVIEMPLVIPFIAQRMFGVITLPDAPPSVGNSGCRAGLFCSTQIKPGLGEMFFDRAPALRIIGIARRQGPNGVQMIDRAASPSHPPGTAASAGNNPEKPPAINPARGHYPISAPVSQ
jgi:hypothetical protein